MRRGCSAVLFFVGGWLMATVAIVGIMPDEVGISPWIMTGFMAALAMPFLLVATWVSPGKRLAELGLTLMIAAGCAAFMVLAMAAMFLDPAMKRYMPKTMPAMDFTSLPLVVALLAMGGGGFALWRMGRKRGRRPETE